MNATPAENHPGGFEGALRRIWTSLTAAPSSVHDLPTRRRVALLNRMLLALAATIIVGACLCNAFYAWTVVNQFWANLFALAMIAVVLLCFALSRSGHHRAATLLCSSSLTALILLSTRLLGGSYIYWPLFYLFIPLGLVSIYHGLTVTIVFAAANLAAMSSLPWILPETRFDELPTLYYLTMTISVIVVKHYRGVLEGLRQNELAANQIRYQSLLETAFEGIALMHDHVVIEANTGFAHLFGIPPEQLSGSTLSRFLAVPFDDLREKHSGETMGRALDGRTLHLEYAFRTFDVPHTNMQVQMIAFRDITARRLAEMERNRLHAAIEQVAESVIITDPDQKIVYVNPALTEMTGYGLEELLGQLPHMLNSGKYDAVSLRSMWAVLNRGESWQARFSNRRKDGSLYEMQATVSPIMDADGKLVNYVSVGRDITRELQLERQYRQSQKMEAVGQLAGGVAHDFNNLLQAIRGYNEMAMMHVAPDSSVYHDLCEVAKAADRAASLVRQLLAFSRSEAMHCEVLDLNEVVSATLKMLRRLIGEHIELTTSFFSSLRPVYADRGQMDQVLLNLCVNARDAMPLGGLLRIETRMMRLDESFVACHEGAKIGDYVMLRVSDTGGGIPPEMMDHIFEPFFTTKEVGKGTGLGLATVYGIVRQHDGVVEVASIANEGAVFSVFLPVCKSTAESDHDLPGESHPAGGLNETILVAEDDEMVRGLATLMLERAGYRVVAARNGEEAVAVFEQHQDSIRLALLDVVMPKRGGREVADLLHGLRPGLPILFASGYDFNMLPEDLPPDAKTNLIRKPFRADDLLGRVRQLLDASREGS